MTKHFLLGVSFLPALLIMPAVADTVDARHVITENTTYNNLVASNIAETTANNGGVFYMEDVQDVTLTFNGITSFTGNSLMNGGMGGAIGNGWLSTTQPDVYPLYTPGGKIVFNGFTTFTNNTTNNINGGGAIFNYGIGNLESPDIKFNESVTFIGNSVTGSSSSDIIGGGAIHHRGGMIVFDDIANFNQNTSASKGGAIISTGDMVFNEAATFSENTASSSGGAIAAMGGHITFNDTATFTGNTASAASAIFATSDITFNGAATFSANVGQSVLQTNGSNSHIVFNNGATFSDNVIGSANGALFNAKGSSITVSGGNLVFTGNTGGTGGGIQTSGNVTVNTTGNVLFEDNETVSSGGALSTDGQTTLTANKVSFIDNIANVGYGGAVFNAGDLSILGNENIFTGNQAKDTGATKSGGGAIHNRGQTGTATLIVGVTNGTNEFTSNTSKAHGGAIVARAYDGQNQDSDVTINGTTTFTTNHADLDGGAIWNSVAPKENTVGHADFVINGVTTFTGNTAGGKGGAIYNNDSFTFNNSVTFEDNEATVNGGAIYNAGTMTLTNATFTGNEAVGTYTPNQAGTAATYSNGAGGAIWNSGNLTVGGLFEDNTAFSGGAVRNTGTLTVNNGSTFRNNNVNIAGGAIYNTGTLHVGNNVLFDNNSAYIAANHLDTASGGSEMGAAIYSEGTSSATRTMTFGNGVKFTDNSSYGGTLYLFGANDVTFGDNVEFSGNYGHNAGAIRASNLGTNGTTSLTIGNNAKFQGNEVVAGLGGAAIMLGNSGDEVEVGNNATVSGNIGTAIYNSAGDITFGSGLLVSGNIAHYNQGDGWSGVGAGVKNMGPATMTFNGATFENNIADVVGGAIFNHGASYILFNGDNTFTGNTANGVANDIQNRGEIEFAGGTTTMDGGITGDGTLCIDDDATLNIGTASISQNTIELNGVLMATLRSGDNAQLTAVNEFSGTGELRLSFAGAGTYNVFGAETFDNININSSIYDLSWSGGTLTATQKSVEDLADQNHLTNDTAAAVINLTTSSSDVLNDLAVAIQEKLATGTDEDRQEVEQAQVAMHPEKESVVQSVTSSVQNAVSSLAMSRMSIPMAGRNGGDVKMTSRGVWVNGIFNKAKQNDAFNGYTRGFAAGLDGTINNNLTIGLGYSFAHSDVDGSARDTEIDSSSVFVYGQYRQKAWYVNGVANYTMADYSEKGTALGMPVTADYDVNSYGAHVATGYRFAGGITPELSLRYLHIDGSDYTNSLGIKNELQESDYLTASLGTKYAFRIKVTEAFRLRPELSYAVKYDMLSDKQVATVTMPGLNSYALDGERLSRIGGEFGIGLGARYKGLDVSLNYDIEAREDYTSQSGRMKFRYSF